MNRIYKSATKSAAQDKFNYDDILMEVNKQTIRKKNLVIASIPKAKWSNAKERFESDRDEVTKTVKPILGDSLKLKSVSCLGRYKTEVNRLAKVSCKSEDAKKVLRKKSKLPNPLVSNQTLYQQ